MRRSPATRNAPCSATREPCSRSAMLINDLVNHAVFFGLFRVHDEIALDISFDAFHALAAMLRQQSIDHGAHAQDLFGVEIDVGSLAAEAGHPRLMDEDACVGQSKTFLGRAARKQD